MAINYVHPSVSSTITDNSTVYVTASGTTKLFAVFTSEKGIDNEIKMMTSVSEFVFNYGEPNMKLYGQTAYNIVNWLTSGGIVYCLRVLPEDAGYANAIVNIQSKVGTKQVPNVNGDLVEVDDVELRPCVTYTNASNKTKLSIKENALNIGELEGGSNKVKTVDGYTNHMLFAVIPKGRGAGYNNLGFKMSLAKGYDSTYEFRLYNFEVTMTSESTGTSTIQGPFLVSLDPDAMSNSGASLFIVDVIDSHCDYFNIIFNENAYNDLAKIVNKSDEVHPNRIDFFNGESRIISNEYETYYEEKTGKYEDIHMSLVKYDDQFNPTDLRNIINVNDDVEQSIVEIDSTHRNQIYEEQKTSFERAKKALGAIRKGKDNFNNIALATFDPITNVTTGSTAPATLGNYGSLTEIDLTAFNDAKAVLAEDISEVNYNTASDEMIKLANNISALMSQLYELYDYANIGVSAKTDFTVTSTTIAADLALIESNIKSLSTTEIKCSKFKSTVADFISRYNDLNENAKVTLGEKEEFINDFINEIKPIINSINSISDNTNESSNTFADDKLTEILRYLATIENANATMNQEYVLDEDRKEAIDIAWAAIETTLALDSLAFAINLALLEKKSYVYASSLDSINAYKTTIIKYLEAVKGAILNDEITADSAKKSVDFVGNTLDDKLNQTYSTYLQNYDNNIALKYGSDGSIEGKNYKDGEIEKLIINGYKGTIDNTLTDKDKWPIDMVLDANYSAPIKNAIASLCTELRDDFMGILDTEFQADPEKAIDYRKSSIGVNNFRLAIFTQDFIVEDAQYTGTNIQVTPTYFLASKIPSNDNNFGIHWNFVGPRRGTISGYKTISFLPNPIWRENLYNAQVNYVQQDQVSTRFGSQLTSQSTISALSNISCVRTLLRIQRDVEDLMKTYQFEFNDDVTITNAQTALNSYLNQWVSNRACDSISGTVYASDYDRQQKLLRVKVELVFNAIIERIAIDLIVNA